MSGKREQKLKEQMKKDAQAAHKAADAIPALMVQEVEALKWLKSVWKEIKESDLYKNFRASKLNPYHFGVKEIKADNLEKARRIAREIAKTAKANGKKHRAEFIYNGTRYYADKQGYTQ